MSFEDTIAVIQNVAKEFPEFKKTALEKRKSLLEGFTFALVHRKTELVSLLQKETKSTESEANLELVESLNYLHFLKTRWLEEYAPPRVPVGPCLIYGSWNSPVLRFCEGVMTALVFGNSVLLHCSPDSLGIYSYMYNVLKEIGLPEKALAILGDLSEDTSDLLYAHPAIRAVHFSGLSYEGEFLKNKTLDPRKRYKVNFGGHNPVIFLYDADLSELEELVLRALRFHYQGEMRFNRWFVQEKIYPEVCERVKVIFENLMPDSVGGFPNSTFSTQFSTQAQTLMKEKNWWPSSGPISVSYDFNNCSPWQQQETLGPVLTLTRFKNSVEAIKFVNTTFFANAACVFSSNMEKARELGNQLQMPLLTYNRIPERFWEKPLHSFYESGFGNDVLDLDFFSVPRVPVIH